MIKTEVKALLVATIITGILLAISLVVILRPATADTQPTIHSVYINLTEGKNYVSFIQPMYVREVMKKNTDLETISYFDEEQNKTIGYVRALGGIGKNFLIVPGQTYEIVAAKNTTLRVD
jgi:hypothetical protein